MASIRAARSNIFRFQSLNELTSENSRRTGTLSRSRARCSSTAAGSRLHTATRVGHGTTAEDGASRLETVTSNVPTLCTPPRPAPRCHVVTRDSRARAPRTTRAIAAQPPPPPRTRGEILTFPDTLTTQG